MLRRKLAGLGASVALGLCLLMAERIPVGVMVGLAGLVQRVEARIIAIQIADPKPIQPFMGNPIMLVVLHTTHGDITLELNTEKAPVTAANFAEYARAGFYSGTIFHRVIDGFMVQGGGLAEDMNQKKTNAPIKNEANNGLKNDVGTIAMARTMDPHSATAQFFINVKNNDFLNFSSETSQGWGYCVFGKVTEGMDVVNKIKSVPTTSRFGHQDVPVDPITIVSVEVKE